MGKALINKHINKKEHISRSRFVEDINKAKGEIIVCNDTTEPGLFILDSDENVINITQKNVVDSVLDSESVNPVQNKTITEALNSKQELLKSGVNIKTINGQDIIGSGNIEIVGDGTGMTITVDDKLDVTSINPVQNKTITQSLTKKADKTSLHKVALSGKYSDLLEKPEFKTINGQAILGTGDIVIDGDGNSISIDEALDADSTNPVQNKVITKEINKKANALDLSTVATSGNYADLHNTPKFKTVNNTSIVGDGNINVSANYESSISNGDITVVKDYGDIKAGTPLSELNGKTYAYLFDAILFPTVVPTFVAPSATLSLNNYNTSNGIVKVGTIAPTESKFNKSFNKGSIMLNGVKQNNRAGDIDAASSFIYVNNNTDDKALPTTISFGETSYIWRAFYQEGPQPYTNKGNEYSSPLQPGYVNSNKVTINGTLPWFATTSGTSIQEQALIAWNEFSGKMQTPEFTLVPTETTQQIISVPRAITNIYIKDTNSGNFIETDLSAYNRMNEKVTVNEVEYDYYTYTYTGAGRGEITLKIKF